MWNEYRLVGRSIPSCRPNTVDDEERSLTTDLSNRIPMEVYENVIEHMDQCTLYSSALVCQAWNPRASYLLYLTILITSRASYDLLVKQLRTSPRVQRWLQSTRQVALGEHWTDSVTPFLDAFPLVFGHACPALQGLNIGYVLRPNMHPTFHVALRQLHRLVSLRLHHVELSNSTQLRRIVCAFPCLKELALDAVLLLHPQLPQSAGGRPQNDPSRGSCNIRPKRLQVVSDTDKHVQMFGRTADWLISSGICSSLAELVTAFYGTHTELAIEHVNRLLETMGQSLTSFYCHSDLNLLHHSPCNLVHNTALRQLTVRLNVDPYQPTEVSEWADAANELRGVFSTVRSYQLEHITAHFRFVLPSPVNEENFRQSCKQLDSDSRGLHDVMVRPYFHVLAEAKIEIEVECWVDSEDDRKEDMDRFVSAMEPILRRLFAPWHDRGVVNVNVTSTTTKLWAE